MIEPGSSWVFPRAEFPSLLAGLERAGYRVVGPTVRDGAIVYGTIRSVGDLPEGWTDRQEAGTYRLAKRDDGALFGYNVGPHSWKKYLFPPREQLFTLRRDGSASFEVTPPPDDEPPLAFLGIRACEIAAMRIQDRVFVGGGTPDAGYARRARSRLVVAVQCGQAGGTCFCVSMGTGPAVRAGYDLSLTELIEPGRHDFLVQVGTPEGAGVLADVPMRPATPADLSAGEARVARAAQSMGRTMDTTGVHEVLLRNLESPVWEDVGRRCLACTNCTLACPTCFCHSTEEVPDLSAERVERWRRWDSCFNLSFSELHNGSVRATVPARYRQWLTHKLATWFDQFGSSGCVGCGRCVTWCPVGIDLTAEVRAIRAADARAVPPEGGPAP